MKTNLILVSFKLLTVISHTLTFNFLNFNSTQEIKELLKYSKVEVTDPRYLEDLSLIEKEKESSLLTVCMIQVRNCLYYKHPQINSILNKASSSNKEKYFDKILLEFFYSCKDYFNSGKVDLNTYMNSEKILVANEVLSILKIDEKKFNENIVFSDIEKELLKVFFNGSYSKQEREREDKEKEMVDFYNNSEDISQESSIFRGIPNFNIHAVKYIIYGIISGVCLSFFLFVLIKYLLVHFYFNSQKKVEIKKERKKKQ